MKLKVDNGPHIKSNNSTSRMMAYVLMALAPIVVFSIYKNSFLPFFNGYTNLLESMHPIFIILIACFTSIISEVLFMKYILKKSKNELHESMFNSYAILPGLFLALIIPINTPLIIVAIGAFIATVVGKMLFGGFGYNIFNPALVGCLFVISSYGSFISSNGGYLNKLELSTIGGATPLSNLASLNYTGTYDAIVGKFGDLSNFFFGTIPGTLGETSKFLILIAFIFLVATKVIKWRIPTFYITTVFLMTLAIGYTNNMSIWYSLFQILSGGLLFGAVFMATDPVTTPVTSYGQILFGVCLGILTVSLRFLTNYPEGVLTSILVMNMLVFIFDKIGVKAKINIRKFIIPSIIVFLLLFSVTLYISNSISNKKVDNVTILNVEHLKSYNIYTVNTKGFGVIKASVKVSHGRVLNINIIDSSAETQWSEIMRNDYINVLINNQKDINNVDTISGSTMSSKALKDMIIKIIETDLKG